MLSDPGKVWVFSDAIADVISCTVISVFHVEDCFLFWLLMRVCSVTYEGAFFIVYSFASFICSSGVLLLVWFHILLFLNDLIIAHMSFSLVLRFSLLIVSLKLLSSVVLIICLVFLLSSAHDIKFLLVGFLSHLIYDCFLFTIAFWQSSFHHRNVIFWVFFHILL